MSSKQEIIRNRVVIENGLIMAQLSVAEEKETLTLVESKADQVKAMKLINMNE